LKIAVAEHPHTSAIRSGEIQIEGVDADIVTVKPQIGAFRRMVRDLEFDVCEIAPTTYIIARAYGKKFKALPILSSAAFITPACWCARCGDQEPKDLEGKSVGVRAYSVTTGAWTRQVLIDEFGVDNNKINWFVDDEEHVQELQLPANVRHVTAGDSLADMMARGDIVAGFHAAAGIGRTGAPTGGWQEVEANYPDLFPNAVELEGRSIAAPGSIRCMARSWSRMPCWRNIPGSPAPSMTPSPRPRAPIWKS
jgi:4,5-dihydroxyphthalate decarboxylase